VGSELVAAVVGAAVGAAGGWAAQWALGKSSTRASRADGLEAKIHDHEVRITVLEVKADASDAPRRR
jgi:hypothetical protein